MNIHPKNITVFNTVIIFNLFKSFNLFSTHCFFSYKIIRFQKITVTDTLDKHIKVDFEIKGFDDLSIDGGSLTVTVEVLNTFDRRIQAIVSYRNASDTVIVTLAPKNFAQYGNFYDKNSTWWATGDTLRGPFHTDDEIKTYGRPVFLGFVTTKKGVKKYDSNTSPEFHGGLESGIEIPLEFDTPIIRIAAFTNGKIFRDTSGKKKITDVN